MRGTPVHVVSGGGNVHHLNGAAGQPEGERPQGTLPAPVHQVVHPAHQSSGSGYALIWLALIRIRTN
jgi:hypothetical protein